MRTVVVLVLQLPALVVEGAVLAQDEDQLAELLLSAHQTIQMIRNSMNTSHHQQCIARHTATQHMDAHLHEVLHVVRVDGLEKELHELLLGEHHEEGHHVHVLREDDVRLAVRLDGREHPLPDLIVRVVLHTKPHGRQ